ncbi:4-alpha-glucanotransferase [Anaerosporobacter faecicola]|uniref:4-alpha-glucanotransferase n=1 Tax=Anaerosporobacter faecicola TaxID=2718714 RepID=UPI00143B2197|nr:4-alpha-glucanotransferase [Anaerosporobacter faecicola]
MANKNTELTRGAGLLLPVSSLPSPYGIGTFGKAGYDFVDTLVEAKQIYWQVLPLGPTSYGDSPYQSFSAFAGNPYFIDLDTLIEEGILKKSEVEAYDWGQDDSKVDYEAIYNSRFHVLKKAFERSKHQTQKSYIQFCNENEYWLDDYSLYMAIKNHFESKEWLLWDEDIRFRKPEAVASYQKKLKNDVDFWKFCQYKFYEQWFALKAYANKKGIQIIGDIPLYVAMDSSDVWVHGDLFELDERKKPINIAGVPPDCFSVTGQRWGNPLYDWNKMEQDDFSWWRKRMSASAKLYDVVRIDHFIGIVRYFRIPAECETAERGKYKKGPGSKLTKVIVESIGDAKIIAEDLGVIIPSVRQLMERTGFPGMKILQFAFNSGPESEYLPHNYKTSNTVVYGGTHDNQTLVGYLKNMEKKEEQYACEYLGVKRKNDIPDAVVKLAYASNAAVAIFQVQDILKLDDQARMNLPSSLGGNWQWRMTKGQLSQEDIMRLHTLADTYGR